MTERVVLSICPKLDPIFRFGFCGLRKANGARVVGWLAGRAEQQPGSRPSGTQSNSIMLNWVLARVGADMVVPYWSRTVNVWPFS